MWKLYVAPILIGIGNVIVMKIKLLTKLRHRISPSQSLFNLEQETPERLKPVRQPSIKDGTECSRI